MNNPVQPIPPAWLRLTHWLNAIAVIVLAIGSSFLVTAKPSPYDSLAMCIKKQGVIFYGSVRDQEGLNEIKGFNAWFKGQDPSYIKDMTLTTINAPIRIGRATVLPGDVVLAKKYGTIFIPAALVEELVLTSEVTQLRDEFGHLRLREGKYLTGQIDSEWTPEIKTDFLDWLNHYPGKLPMTHAELDAYLKERNY